MLRAVWEQWIPAFVGMTGGGKADPPTVGRHSGMQERRWDVESTGGRVGLTVVGGRFRLLAVLGEAGGRPAFMKVMRVLREGYGAFG